MPTTQTVLRDPPLRGDQNTSPMQYWFFGLQNAQPLRTVDTSAGSYSEATPQPGADAAGQTNQNVEITYKKISADGNTFTLTGVADGPQTLTTQFSHFKIKSDGTNWWVTG